MSNVLEELDTAKRNVVWLLDHANGLVDMHGLAYWAGRVEIANQLRLLAERLKSIDIEEGAA